MPPQPPTTFEGWTPLGEFSVRREVTGITSKRAPRWHPKASNLKKFFHGAHPWPLAWGGPEVHEAHFNAHRSINTSIQKRAENAVKRASEAIRGSGYQLFVTTSVSRYPELDLLENYTVKLEVYHPSEGTKLLGEFTITQSLTQEQRSALQNGKIISQSADEIVLSHNGKMVGVRTKALTEIAKEDVTFTNLMHEISGLEDALRVKGDRANTARTSAKAASKGKAQTRAKGKATSKAKTPPKATASTEATIIDDESRLLSSRETDARRGIDAGSHGKERIPKTSASEVEGSAAKAEGTATKAETTATKAESSLAKAETTASKVGAASKIGALIEGLMPSPVDALFLTIDYFAAYGEARESIAQERWQAGFSYGLAASLLEMGGRWIKKNLVFWGTTANLATRILEAEGIAERSFNNALIAGIKFGRSLTKEEQRAYLQTGFKVLAAEGYELVYRDAFDVEVKRDAYDVAVNLGRALQPTINQALEAIREREERLHKAELKQQEGNIETWYAPAPPVYGQSGASRMR